MKEITSQTNSRLKEFTLLCRDRGERDRKNVCVLDGLKLCRDAAGNGFRILQLWISEGTIEKHSELLEPVIAASDEVFMVSDSAAKRLSETVSPQGVMALVERPEEASFSDLLNGSRVIGLCGVQNPENVGSTIRTAAALGFRSVMLSRDCADPWSPRSLRAGAGTQLSCRIKIADDFVSAVKESASAGFLTIASALHTDSVALDDADRTGKIFLTIGSEGKGLPQDVIEACGKVVHIPIEEGVESLNAAAAAAIMMWELRER